MDETLILNEIDTFIRSSVGEFSTKTVKEYLEQNNYNTQSIDLSGSISAHPYIIKINKDVFTTRANIFTNQWFAIKLLPIEIENKILIPGHKIIPFSDPDRYAFRLEFSYNGEKLQKAQKTIPIADFLETNYLFGEEFIPQLLDADPANENFDITNPDHVLPNNACITIVDISQLFEKELFTENDKLLGRITNWELGEVELIIQKSTKENPFEITNEDELQNEWQKNFIKSLKNTFKTHGPLGSIEEQLAYSLASNKAELFTKQCKPIEECLTDDESVSMSYYGVECRLWKADEEIPAMGPWNEDNKNTAFLQNTLYSEIGIPIPLYMLDAYILDALYKEDEDLTKIVTKMLPDSEDIEEEQIEIFLLRIKERYAKIKKKYNKFSDFEKGEARSRTLALYSDLVDLICYLDTSGSTIDVLPQQQLVILSQLFSHTTKFLDVFMNEESLSNNDLELILESLDGMEEGFEEISIELRQAINKDTNNNDGFTVI